MKSKVYIETTIVSYLVAAPTKDVVQAAHRDHTPGVVPAEAVAAHGTPAAPSDAAAQGVGAGGARLTLARRGSTLTMSNHGIFEDCPDSVRWLD
jgi:hypothetical protein